MGRSHHLMGIEGRVGRGRARRSSGRPEDPSAAGGEEVAQEGGGLVGQQPRRDLGAMVEPTVAHDVPQGAHGAQLVVVRPEDEAVDPGEHQRSGAHRAGLERDDEGATRQAPLATCGGRGAQRDDLGALLDDVELYPDEMLSEIARRLGFGELFDDAVGLTSA